MFGAVGSLKQLDLSNIEMPLNEVRSFLAAKYESRHEMHPRLFELTVASVFGNLGYTSRATGYTHDGGVDVILEHSNGESIGVQVKRTTKRVAVEQIRALIGAMVVEGFTKGVFVTTSAFSSESVKLARRSSLAGYQVELFNAEKFYEALSLAQRNVYGSADDPDGPWNDEHSLWTPIDLT